MGTAFPPSPDRLSPVGGQASSGYVPERLHPPPSRSTPSCGTTLPFVSSILPNTRLNSLLPVGQKEKAFLTNALNSGRKGGFVLPERGGVLKGRSVAVLRCKDGQINPVGGRVVPGDLFMCRLHEFQVFHGVRARVGPFLVSQQTGAWCRRGR